MHRTEGWPVGLSLAALSLAEQPVPASAITRFSGLDRLIAEYLRDEVLAPLDADERQFVLRSRLDMPSTPACEAILVGPERLADPRAAAALGLSPRSRSTARPSATVIIVCSTDLLQAELRQARPGAAGRAAPSRVRLVRPRGRP